MCYTKCISLPLQAASVSVEDSLDPEDADDDVEVASLAKKKQRSTHKATGVPSCHGCNTCLSAE